jgi:hypothetical protein
VPSCLHVLRPALLSRTPRPDANYRRRDRTARSQQPTDHDDPAKPATARRQTRRHTLVEVGHAAETPGDTDAWEHETFREEHARLERGDPEDAEICETVRQAKDKREQASLSADKTKPGGTLGLLSRGDVLLPAAATAGTLTRSSRARAWRRSAYPSLAASCAGAIRDVLVREPCDRQPARGSPASSRTSLIYRTRFSPISERCGALRLGICAAWMPLGRCCSRRGWRAAPPLRA